MGDVRTKSDWLIEKDLFDFPIRYSVLRPVLADVSIVPVASFPRGRVQFDHAQCISRRYTSGQAFFPRRRPSTAAIYSAFIAVAKSIRLANRDGTSPATNDAINVTASDVTISFTGVWNAIVQPKDCLLIT